MRLDYEKEKNVVHILLVEKELNVASLLINLMKSWGWEIKKAYKSSEAYIAHLDDPEDYAFFFSDFNSAKKELRNLGLSVR